ncbi:MFS transporter [Rathayibacter oskolensis]|uniref:MFS transporter n=1 Tax=Rathayibacter oskolensis TaxID=1891671 RepID=UPI00265FFAAD|nr:MFS transporter [Rathayibacter oskolensis]WKK73015.1 MFS transporter [Rathayibacter oskolensis]
MRDRPALSTSALLVHATLIQAVAFLLRPAAVYQAIQLEVPAFALGALGASFAVVPLLIALPVGGLVDRAGARVVMACGSAVTLASAAVLLLAGGTIAGLLVGIALLGAGHLGCVVGQQAVVAGGAAGTRLDSRFGYYTFAASLGQAIGPAFIPLLAGGAVRPDPAPLFVVGGVLAVVLLAVTAAIRSAPRRVVDTPSAGSTLSLLRMPGLARALTTSAIVVAAVDLTVVYLPALGAERGLPAGVVGALLTVRALASMASRLLLGVVTARLGRTRVMVGGVVVSAVCLVLVALPAPTALLFVAVALMGLGLGIGQPITMSWLIERTPPTATGARCRCGSRATASG